MSEKMKQQFGLIRRPWGVFYLKNKTTGEQTSLKTSDRAEAQRLLQARNDAEVQPHLNLALAPRPLTGLEPAERFANHKAGIKAASVVRRMCQVSWLFAVAQCSQARP